MKNELIFEMILFCGILYLETDSGHSKKIEIERSRSRELDPR
jgi:hypothetical protein